MRIRPTELGVKGMLLLAALELAFLATSYSNLFFLLIAFCCVLGVSGLVGAIRNVRGVDVRLTSVPLAAAGAARSVSVAFAGHRRGFDIVLTAEGGGPGMALGHVQLVDGPVLLELPLAAGARGVLRITHLRVASRFPFGLFEVSRRLPADHEIVTYPDPALAGDAAGDGARAARLAATGARSPTVAGLRTFRAGDPLGDVHWKASARRSMPIVKEREAEAGELVEIVLDRRCPTAELEPALSAITGLVLAAQAGGRPLRLHSQDHTVEVTATGPAAATALRWLAAAQPLPASAPEAPRGHAGCLRLPHRRPKEAVRA